MRKITFDIETTDEAAGDPLSLELAVVCIHDSKTDEFSCYTQEELPKLWPILERADVLIGYNSDHFDIPLLNKYYAGDLGKIKSVDLLKEIKNALGRRLRLQNVAEATLGRGKAGNGLDSVDWWKKGLYEKVRDYCIEDVRLTRDLYEYARANKSLKYKDFDGVRDIKLDISGWEKKTSSGTSLTHTLPF